MANGILKVSNIQTSSGSGTITLGQSGETVDFSNATTTLSSAMKNTPAFAVYQSSNVTLTSSTETKLTWDTELFDTDNAFSSNRFTCPSGGAGKYKFYVAARVSTSADSMNTIYLVFQKNGSYVHSGTVTFYNFTNNDIHTFTPTQTNIITLAENDYVEAYISCDMDISSGTLNATANEFSGYRLIGV